MRGTPERFRWCLPLLLAPAMSMAATGEGGGLFAGLRGNLDSPIAHLFIQLLVIVAATRSVGALFTRIGLPVVVGEMVAGIALGPSLLGRVSPEVFAFVLHVDSLGALRLLSQIGVCLFMFSVGMELNLAHARGNARVAIAVSHASMLVPFLLGVGLAYFIFDASAGPHATFTGFALFMGISTSVTAFPVLARILQERRISKTTLGSTAILCAAAGDVTAWSMMAFVIASVRSAHVAAAMLTVALALTFVAAMLLGVRKLLPRVLGQERLTRAEPSSGTLAVVLGVVLASCLYTEAIGVHALFGAFLAGVVMPDVQGFRSRIDARVEQFSSVLLLPLFFAFTGLRTELGLIDGLDGWLLCLVVILVATAGKLGASALAARAMGMGWREALQLGALMNTRGLMEIIVLNVGLDLGILSPQIFSTLVLMAVITTALTGPLLTLFDKSLEASALRPSAIERR